MILYGFYKNSLAYIYDLLSVEQQECEIIDSKQKLALVKSKKILLFKNVNSIINLLPILNSMDNIVFVFDSEEKLKMISNIKILDYKPFNLCKLNKRLNLVYTYKKEDIVQNLIQDSIKGSLLIKLNPILYKSTTSLEQRNFILKEISKYVFEHGNLNRLKKNLEPVSMGKRGLTQRYSELYEFIQQHPNVAKVGNMLKNKKIDWEDITKEFDDVKPFELRYLQTMYIKKKEV